MLDSARQRRGERREGRARSLQARDEPSDRQALADRLDASRRPGGSPGASQGVPILREISGSTR
jgi:hypothetical protein